MADAYERAGADGLVTAEAASGTETTLVVTEGNRLGAGFLSPRFADAERGEVVPEDAHVLLTDEVVTDARELLPILEEVAREGRRLLLIVGGVEGEARALLLRNVEQALLMAVAVRVPGPKAEREALLGNLALMTGSTVVSASRGRRLAAVRLADLGGSAAPSSRPARPS